MFLCAQLAIDILALVLNNHLIEALIDAVVRKQGIKPLVAAYEVP